MASNYKRLGIMLCTFSILRKDAVDRHRYRHTRQLLQEERVNMVCIASLNAVKVQEMLSSIDREVIWLNLRPNPCIFIDGHCYELRNVYGPVDSNVLLSSHIYKNIEEQEERLKNEIKQEMALNNGHIMVHDVSRQRTRANMISPVDVCTPKEFFRRNGSISVYYRLPIPKTISVLKNDIFEVLSSVCDTAGDRLVVFYSASGGSRTTFVSCLYRMLCFKQSGLLAQLKDIDKEKETVVQKDHGSLNQELCMLLKSGADNQLNSMENAFEFYEKHKLFKSAAFKDKDQIVFQIKQLLSGNILIINGIRHIIDYKCSKNIVDGLLEQYEECRDLKFNIAMLLTKNAVSCNKHLLVKASTVLEWYMTLILFLEYLLQNTGTPFVEWIQGKEMYQSKFLLLDKSRGSMNVFKPVNFGSKFYAMFKQVNICRDTNYFVLYKEKKSGTMHVSDKKLHPMSVIEGKHLIRKSVLLNLLEEPLVYIKNEAYLMRHLLMYKNSLKILESVSYKKLEEIENRMKARLYKQYRKNMRIVYYTEESNSLVRKSIVELKEDDIKTPNEYFLSIVDSKEDYYRLPLTPNFHFNLNNFTSFMKIIRLIDITDKDVYAVSYNTKRAIFCCIWIDIVHRRYGNDWQQHSTNKLHSIRELVRVLNHGYSSLCIVNSLFQKYSGTDICTYLKSTTSKKSLVIMVKRYFHTICFASYLLSGSSLQFDVWMLSRPEICNMYGHIADDVHNGHLFITVDDSGDKELAWISSRRGTVLSTMTILKNDYFKGFSLFRSMCEIHGIFNMRYMAVMNHVIVGCAMPKADAIRKLVRMVTQQHSKKDAVIHWFCMREEPVIYINQTPYVLRTYARPYENIEIAGISPDIIQKVEVQLKKDVYNEIRDNCILLHDEAYVQEECVIKHEWTEVETVQTMEEAYTGRSIRFHRVPISDERAPMPRIIDYLHSKLTECDGDKVLFFNCQLGRGRTTTFMILAYMTLMRNQMAVFPWNEAQYKKPRFMIIQQLLKFLPSAEKSKTFADYAIDKFDHIENIRDIIEEYSRSAVPANVEKAKCFLLRYLYVICYAAFTMERHDCFTGFLISRPEIQNLVNSKLNEDLTLI